MKSALEKIIIYILFFSTIVLLVVLVTFFYNNKKIKSSSDLVELTQEILRRNDNVFLDILNIESYSRGYILTGDNIFLEPFNDAVKKTNKDLAELTMLTKDNLKQQLRIDSLKKRIENKLIFAKQNIDARKYNKLNEKEIIRVSENGKILTDKIRVIIADIKSEELSLLKKSKIVRKNSNEISGSIFIMLIVFVFIIIALITIIIKNQILKTKMANELKKTNTLFISLFNHNPASIVIKDLKDGKILKVNDSFLKIYGFNSVEEVIGKTSEELKIYVNPKQGEEITQLLKENIIIKDLETNIQTKQGEIKWTSASIIIQEVDNLPCLFSVSIDITNRKKAEEQLLAVNKELEAFTYSVSHDLRAPLRAVNGYATILKEDYAAILDADGMSSINAIMKNSKKMGELIDDLLSFSRLGRKVVATSEINMNALVNAVKEEEIIGNKDNIEFKINELIPANGQQPLIKQVWVNLISNAIKYSRHKPKISIEIGSYYKDNLVVYFIKDNGAGFDMQYYDKLFGVFQRLHSQEDFEGTGIGLAIVQKIIQRHNGNVWAESKLNEGTCFYFSLPNINS